jgi:hypothetical protein
MSCDTAQAEDGPRSIPRPTRLEPHRLQGGQAPVDPQSEGRAAQLNDEIIHLPDQSPPSTMSTAGKSKRSGSETRKLSLNYGFRLTHGERAELAEAAKAAGMDIGPYALKMALSVPENRSGEPHRTLRAEFIPFRWTETERKQIEADAERAGLSIGSYIRARALKKPVTLARRRPPVENEHVAALTRAIGRLGGNLYQLVRAQNFGRDVPAVQAQKAIDAVQEASQLLIRILGRAPKPRVER